MPLQRYHGDTRNSAPIKSSAGRERGPLDVTIRMGFGLLTVMTPYVISGQCRE